jgi:hypothetical protein
MADRVRPDALRNALTTLRGYLDDLARSSFDDHATKLRLFVNYFQKDDTVRYLAERLHMRLRDVLRQALAPKLDLPSDPLDRISFIYEVLFHLKSGERLDVREFLSRAFEGGSIEAKWDDFRRRWLSALVEGFRDLNERIEAILDEDPVDPELIFHISMHTGVDDEFGDPEPELKLPPLAPTEVELTPVKVEAPSAKKPTLEGLQAMLALQPRGVREDLEADFEVLELELQKKSPDRERLDDIVNSFWAASAELGEMVRALATKGAPAPEAKKPAKAAPAPVKKAAPIKKIAPKKPLVAKKGTSKKAVKPKAKLKAKKPSKKR